MEQVFRTTSLVLKRCKAELSIILYDSVASWQLFFSSQVNLTSIVLAEVSVNSIKKGTSIVSYFHKTVTWNKYLQHQIYSNKVIHYSIMHHFV